MQKLDNVYRMRITDEQKELLFVVVPDEYEASSFWRGVCVSIAHRLRDVANGYMDPQEFGVWMSMFAAQYKKIVTGEVKVDERTRAMYESILYGDAWRIE